MIIDDILIKIPADKVEKIEAQVDFEMEVVETALVKPVGRNEKFILQYLRTEKLKAAANDYWLNDTIQRKSKLRN